ncbi:MAG: acetyl-CoA carboxylase biotin carboxyl carrier protein subunit [Bacteroidota bacterium]
MDYQVTVNDNHEFQLTSDDLKNLDLTQLGEYSFHLIKDQVSYSIEVLSVNSEEKSLELLINNRPYQVHVKDQYDLLVKKLGLSSMQGAKQKQIKAPMPGLVLDIIATEGQKVVKGDSLLILEAMKMENVIKTAGEGTIKKIRVQKGDKVDKNQLLVELD